MSSGYAQRVGQLFCYLIEPFSSAMAHTDRAVSAYKKHTPLNKEWSVAMIWKVAKHLLKTHSSTMPCRKIYKTVERF